MFKTKNKKGFTLVELIVVITILAILGTIAFLSFGSYSGSARDSKRTSDVRNLVSQINIKHTSGISLVTMVNSGSNSQVSTIQLGGTGVTATEYTAGTPNYTMLGVSSDNFKDPDNINEYVIGATTKIGGAFQVAAKLENDSTAKALVMGNYNPRTTDTATGTWASSSSTYTLTTGMGLFKTNDFIKTVNSAYTGQVTAISTDLSRIYVSTGSTSATGLTLASTESTGLIDAGGTTTGVVTNNGAVLPY